MALLSRGFRRGRRERTDGRLPPGQYDVGDGVPVLSAGPTPRTPLSEWDLSVDDVTGPLAWWTWEEFRALPREPVTVDLHCVTTWSKFDTRCDVRERRGAALGEDRLALYPEAETATLRGGQGVGTARARCGDLRVGEGSGPRMMQDPAMGSTSLRSYEPLTDDHLERLAKIAGRDREDRFARVPRWGVYRDRVLLVALCHRVRSTI